MIGALALDGFRGFMTINSGTSSDVFHAFIKHQLAPNLRRGDLVILDNLRAHKNKNSLRLIRKRGAKVLFLPPYSPEYNPIEQAWAKIKQMLRRLTTLSRDTFEKALNLAINAISPHDFLSWALFAGYTI